MVSNTEKRLYGIIGFPLGHSVSKDYFNEKFKREELAGYRYKNFEIKSILEFPDIILNFPNLMGLNVTHPYKESIINFLDQLDPIAREVGAVNTIKITPKKNSLKIDGYNTDCDGFYNTLQSIPIGQGDSAIIFGNGGASKAVQVALKKFGINYICITRKPDLLVRTQTGYNEITDEKLYESKIWINTTILGMGDLVNLYPLVNYKLLTQKHILYDLIYNPEMTAFLRIGKQAGCYIKNGLEMLQNQAELSFKIWEK